MKAHSQKTLWKDISVYPKEVSAFAERSYSRIRREGITSMLELGCGIGNDAIFFAGKGLEVLAIDFSAQAISCLNRHKKEMELPNLACRVKDFTKPWPEDTYAPKSFDAVYAHRSLHYFDEKTTKKIFGNVYDVLKPSGLFFVAVHSALHEAAEKGRMIERGLYINQGKQRRFFSMPCIKKYLNSSFEIVSMSYNDKDTKSFLEVIARRK